MGVRNHDKAELTVACAFVDAYVSNLSDYIAKKEFLQASLEEYLHNNTRLRCAVKLNVADDYQRESIYLTVTGTSGEGGDDGQIGRGNRINGLITPYRPMSLEAASGKNPQSHVGRIYNFWAREMSQKIVDIFGVRYCECYLVSQIGSPVNKPHLIDIRIIAPQNTVFDANISKQIEDFIFDFLERSPLEPASSFHSST
jgi:S-adenosylmethionine synthetase